DEHLPCGTQPADISLINRRVEPRRPAPDVRRCTRKRTTDQWLTGRPISVAALCRVRPDQHDVLRAEAGKRPPLVWTSRDPDSGTVNLRLGWCDGPWRGAGSGDDRSRGLERSHDSVLTRDREQFRIAHDMSSCTLSMFAHFNTAPAPSAGRLTELHVPDRGVRFQRGAICGIQW